MFGNNRQDQDDAQEQTTERDPRDILAKLAEMRAAGEISAEEFQAARQKILSQLPKREQRKVEADVRKAEKWKPSGRTYVIAGIIIFGWIVYQNSTSNNSTSTTRAASTQQASAEEQEKRRKGFHCLSGWDGSNRAFVEAVKGSMREPGSFEHIETRIAPVAEGQHTITMQYRGRNGFGGMNVENAVGAIDTGCRLVEWTAL